MNDDAFARLVAEEVKNRVSKTQAEFLRMPDNWDRWQRALIALCSNLEQQLSTLQSDAAVDRSRYEGLGADGIRLLAEAMSDYENRSSKINRFKFHVEKRLDEVTRMIAVGSSGGDGEMATAIFLRTAINKHRDLLQEFDIEPTPVDQALWSTLDGVWAFDSIVLEDL